MPKMKSIPIHTDVVFETGPGYVRAGFPQFMIVDGIQFTSVEMIMEFSVSLMEKAKEVWPDNPIIKMYLEDS